MTAKESENQLSTEQRRAIAVLVSGGSFEAAALAAGRVVGTIYKWRTMDDAFNRELDKHARTAVKDATLQMTGSLTMCVDFLQEVIQDTDVTTNTRVRAALGLIDRQIRMLEVTDIMVRLEALEDVTQSR